MKEFSGLKGQEYWGKKVKMPASYRPRLYLLWVIVWSLCSLAVVFGQTPPLPLPNRTPITAETTALGRMLYWDTRLSIDNTVACASCHHPDAGYSDNRVVAVGVRGQAGTINSPTTLGTAFGNFFRDQTGRLFMTEPLVFVDGRTRGLPTQSLQPLVNPIEMGNNSEQQVLNRLRRIQGYQVAFGQAYGNKPNGGSLIDRDRFGHALASYQSTLVVNDDTPLARRWRGEDALTKQQEHGLQLMLKAKCFVCHVPPLFTDKLFHNNGMGYATGDLDGGRSDINGRGNSIRAWKTPSLLEAQKTRPYSHNGRMLDLERVVRHYNAGGAIANGTRDGRIDPRIQPQGWSLEDEAAVTNLLRFATASPTYPHDTMPSLPR